MKKLMTLLVLTLPLSVWADGRGTTGECNWSYTSANATLTISGDGKMADYYFMNYSPWSSFASSIATAEIQKGVAKIGSYTCHNCTNLTSVSIAHTVDSIGRLAFYNCSKLPSVAIPEGVRYIDFRTFRNCYALTTVSLPSTLGSMNDDVFGNCPLQTVYCAATAVPTSGDNFTSIAEDATLYVPSRAIEDYKATAPWSNFAHIVAMPKCATPTITCEGGKLKFSCATAGVTFFSQITPADAGGYDTSEIDLGLTYQVNVYATAEGYENSDTVTATIQLNSNGIRGDVNQDGKVSITDATEVINIILGK